MKYYIIIISLFFFGNINTQSEAETQVKQTIETFFKGFHKGDTTLMRSVLADKVVTQSTYTNKKGENILHDSDINEFIKAIAKRPENQKWDERLLEFKIRVDGTMANAWTPYEFWLNGEFSHCGVNSFQLFNDNGKWKIIYLIDTRRRKGCQE